MHVPTNHSSGCQNKTHSQSGTCGTPLTRPLTILPVPLHNNHNCNGPQYIKANFRLGSDLKALIIEAWKKVVTIEMINKLVDSMVMRMTEVLAGDGQMTGW
ncbi:hypothetical protein B0T16DRAFT_139657 [Cercophora newfieldiana]|uniref:Uncharacterized protein n=1 Tax=Cercophora newfieldiana TaxID=92897 RepID=A0AA39Y4R9_9PEZI|nr:hypothetical protein B0T16DRAFT_139657 [Cercophora newfieldiana]